MIKTIAVFFAIAFMSFNALACDICNVYMGLTPNSNVNYMQISYRSRMHKGIVQNSVFKTEKIFGLRHGGGSGNELIENDRYKQLYNVYDVRGKFYLSKKQRFSLFFSIPISNNYQSINEITDVDVIGFSDPILILSYDVLKSIVYDTSSLKHELSFGGGLKAPLGEYNKLDAIGNTYDTDLQLGSGSWDVVLMAQYVLRYKKIGVQISPSYKMNTSNNLGFKFGNTFNLATNFFYYFKINNSVSFLPSVGLFFENAENDSQDGMKIDNTLSNVLFASLGGKLVYKKISVGGTLEQVASQNTGEYQVPVYNRFNLNLQYNF